MSEESILDENLNKKFEELLKISDEEKPLQAIVPYVEQQQQFQLIPRPYNKPINSFHYPSLKMTLPDPQVTNHSDLLHNQIYNKVQNLVREHQLNASLNQYTSNLMIKHNEIARNSIEKEYLDYRQVKRNVKKQYGCGNLKKKKFTDGGNRNYLWINDNNGAAATNIDGATANTVMTADEIEAALDAIGIGPNNFKQSKQAELLEKFRLIYDALTFIGQERKILKTLISPFSDVPNVCYQMPNTNNIQTHIKFSYRCAVEEFNLMLGILTTAKHHFDENSVKVSDILMKDFLDQVKKLSNFEYSTQFADTLLDLLKVIFTYVRYAGINYIVLRRQIEKSKGKPRREMRRNIGG